MIMSEFKNDFGSKKIRSKKLNTRVDLTAMVSISFLLIIFFMVTKELSKPRAMFLEMPSYSCGPGGCWGENRVLTLLLGDNNKIISYWGNLYTPIEAPKELKYGKESIRKELLNKNQQMQEHTGDPKKGLIVIIKPSNKSNFGNLVAVLDEMNITKIATYAVVSDFTSKESELLIPKHLN